MAEGEGRESSGMSVSDDIAREQAAALRTVRAVAEQYETLFTNAEESNTLEGEAGPPDAGNIKQALTPNRPS